MDLDFWIDRYKKLLSILQELEANYKKENTTRVVDWSVHKGTEISLDNLDQKLPNDFKAFISLFGDECQIGVKGTGLVGVEVPQNHKNSEVFKVYYDSDERNDDEVICADSDCMLKDIHWFGYTSSAFDVVGFQITANPYKVIGPFQFHETFDGFLCSIFADRLESTELSSDLGEWMRR